ncbi:MAG: hypothetical protein QOH99_1295 [Frankiaceae bacterium]|nr:hypothetical protein [Frankiaceae bacterium]
MTKTVIVGGVAGGMSAATRLRRLDEHHEIVVLERSGYVSYANSCLPYHLGGVIDERDALLLQSPQSLASRFRLDVRVRSEVVAIDRDRCVVRVRDLDNGGEYEESWDHLVLSPGARPIVPDAPGVRRAMALRTVEDMDRIAAALDAGVKTAAVVGGGFVGLEVAENLHRRGIAVSIVELGDQVLAPLDPELAALVHVELRRRGVTLSLGAGLAKVLPTSLELTDGTTLPADLVVLAIGVRPEVRLATDAGLAVGQRGGILADEFSRTSDPRIYAVGDAVEKTDEMSEDRALIPLANIANRQGRLVADHIAGRATAQRPHFGTAIVRVFGLQVGVVGWNEKRLRAAARDHLVMHTHPTSHAGYFPDAEQMALKLMVDPDGTILGAQGVGIVGIDKRIDVLATAMYAGIPAAELAALELAYAPQYGSAKDPVNMLGYVAGNRLSGDERAVQWHELAAVQAAGATVLDVRDAVECAGGSIPGSVHIPLDDLRSRHRELPAGLIVAHCGVGQRSHTAVAILSALGHDSANLDGGYRTWLGATSDRDAIHRARLREPSSARH